MLYRETVFCSSNEEMINFNYRRALMDLNFDFGLEDKKNRTEVSICRIERRKCLEVLKIVILTTKKSYKALS